MLLMKISSRKASRLYHHMWNKLRNLGTVNSMVGFRIELKFKVIVIQLYATNDANFLKSQV